MFLFVCIAFTVSFCFWIPTPLPFAFLHPRIVERSYNVFAPPHYMPWLWNTFIQRLGEPSDRDVYLLKGAGGGNHYVRDIH